MTEWIRRPERVTNVHYSLGFAWDVNDPHSGFGFDCDEDGNVTITNPAAQENYQACLTGVVDGRVIHPVGVLRYENRYWEPGLIKCVRCGAEVELDMVMTNTCDACITCGQIENFSWHKMTAEECEAWMQAHTNGERGCARASEHHEYQPCNTDYNSSGQRLAPRSQWGWDTGETADEILASDWGINDPIPARTFDE